MNNNPSKCGDCAYCWDDYDKPLGTSATCMHPIAAPRQGGITHDSPACECFHARPNDNPGPNMRWCAKCGDWRGAAQCTVTLCPPGPVGVYAWDDARVAVTCIYCGGAVCQPTGGE